MTDMKQYIRQLLLLCLVSLSVGMGAQEIVGPEGPDRPSLNQTITVTQSVGGTISPAGSGGQVVVATNANQTFTVEAADGYVIEGVTVDGVPQSITSGLVTYPYTFTNIVANHTLTASFTTSRFTLEAEAGPGGTIVPTTALVAKGESQTFTIIPGTGYEIASLTVDGRPVETASTYTFSRVEKGGKLSATFKALEYTVSLSTLTHGGLEVKDTSGKSIKDGDKVPYGTTLILTSRPEAGYAVDRITANNLPVNGAAWKVTSDVTFAATFKKAVHTVTVDGSSAGGNLTVRKGATALLAGMHTVEYGTELVLENKPATGYSFTRYEVNPASLLSEGKITVTGNVAVRALFTPLTYKVTVTAPEAAEGLLTINGATAATGEEEYPYQTELVLGNRPATGKDFEAYVVNPPLALSGNKVKVTGDISLSIRFKTASGSGEGTDPEGNKLYAVTYSAPPDRPE